MLGGRYRIGDLLGAGGMGRVFRAVHVELGRPCAVKVIRPPDSGLGSDWRVARARFRVEALAGARLDHPNVLRVLDFGREPADGLHYLVTEQLEGVDLADVLAAEGPLPAGRIVRIGRGICAALQHAHDRGVIHRDLKPQNVRLVRLTRDDGSVVEEVKLLDFGAALIAGQDLGGSPEGMVLGTLAYMSPEQAAGAEVDARSDLYALGVVLFELATGRLPARHARAPSALGVSMGPRLEAIILGCLRERPADRPRTAREIRDALDLLPARGEPGPPLLVPEPGEPRAPWSSAPFVGAARWVAVAAGITAAVGLWGQLCAEPATSGGARVLHARLGERVVRPPETVHALSSSSSVEIADGGNSTSAAPTSGASCVRFGLRSRAVLTALSS